MWGELRYLAIEVVCALLRMVPWPCRTGLIAVGDPGPEAPVFLTGNYLLTVERVKRALCGLDAYLLVANSWGVNVWCAASGGLFTHHDVITALKVCGIGERVGHRRLILPQLAATGIEARAIAERAGWQVVWGPARAGDIPVFLNAEEEPQSTRLVSFGLRERLEMAAAWASPLSALAALALVSWWREGLLAMVVLIWALALAVYALFPLYNGTLGRKGGAKGTLGRFWLLGGAVLALWVLCSLALLSGDLIRGDLTWGEAIRWTVAAGLAVLGMTVDLPGTTPVLKSGFHAERSYHVEVDPEACCGDGVCVTVCPRGCLSIDPEWHTADVVRPERCVQCGACVVQCPHDALRFADPHGRAIGPGALRGKKLDMMGGRTRSVVE